MVGIIKIGKRDPHHLRVPSLPDRAGNDSQDRRKYMPQIEEPPQRETSTPTSKQVSGETEQRDEAEVGSADFVRGTSERARRCCGTRSDRGGCAA